ncbi:MAG: DUF4105 domain-containing protein [Sphaerochaetaceae bacterium]|nr:DUF4105 domain-containing protein [Sphaerochaetaceae bacterium]
MKKAAVFLFLILLAFPAFCAETPSYYDSQYMLDNFYREDGFQRFTEDFLDNCKISVLYINSGDVLYQWFGHIGILVESKDSESVLFDYGRFEFGPDFYINFAMGRLWYKCAASYARYEISAAAEAGRSIYKRELNLTNEEKAAVITFLNTNSSAEYDTYLYHNYRDNCSTRIRDLLDRITDGQIKADTEKVEGYTYREMANMVLSRNLVILWTLDALEGRNIDLKQSYWDDMFLPSVFFNALEQYPSVASQTVVVSESENNQQYASKPVNYTFKAISAAVILGVLQLIFMFLRRDFPFFSVTGATYSFLLHLYFAILGAVLFFMMFFTLHDYTYLNENLLFMNPLLLVVAFLSIRPNRHRRSLKFFYTLFLSLILVLIMLKIILPGVFIQDNWPQITFFLIFYLCNLIGLKLNSAE